MAKCSSRSPCMTLGYGICTGPRVSSRTCGLSPSRMSTSRSWPRVTSNCRRTSPGSRSNRASACCCPGVATPRSTIGTPRGMPDGKPSVSGMLGLPDGVSACLFDLDGVITRTATVHDAAWKEMFDDFLREYAAQAGGQFVPFDPVTDYGEYVDGKPRLEGTRAFLKSRSIELPEGSPGDTPGTWTIWGLSNAKNGLVLKVLERDGVEVY